MGERGSLHRLLVYTFSYLLPFVRYYYCRILIAVTVSQFMLEYGGYTDREAI